jgi:hypothetical protein
LPRDATGTFLDRPEVVGVGLRGGGYMVAKLHCYIGDSGGKRKGDHGLLTTGLRGWGGKPWVPNHNLRLEPFSVVE